LVGEGLIVEDEEEGEGEGEGYEGDRFKGEGGLLGGSG
jgi:hypothetical protein